MAGPAPSSPVAVATREDALRALLDIAEYFLRTEPLSPLAYTLAGDSASSAHELAAAVGRNRPGSSHALRHLDEPWHPPAERIAPAWKEETPSWGTCFCGCAFQQFVIERMGILPQGIRSRAIMSGSIHDKLQRVRKPRVHITYQVETEGAEVLRELPFVVGILGDFSAIRRSRCGRWRNASLFKSTETISTR